MAGLRKDVELIFRGEDRASPTIKAVRKSVSDLTGAIDEQLSAASRGEGSIDDLAKAYRGLKAAQGDVGEIAKLATAYERQTKALADQAAKTEAAKQKLAALNAEVAAAEKPAKRLQQARDAAERALNASIQKEEQLAAAARETGAALDAAGGDSRDFAKTQDLIRQAAIETARALRDAAAAMDQFKGKQASGQANIAAAAEMEQFNKLAAGSGLPQAQIQFISQLENRLQALDAAIREDQGSMARLNAELERNSFKSAAGSAAALKAGLDEADAAAKRLEATTAFKNTAATAAAGARDISRFGAQADTSAQSFQRLADTVQGILNPVQAATSTLTGLEGVIAQAETVTEGAKRRLSEYNAEANNLQSAAASLQSIARLTDQFRQQEGTVAAARAEMERAQAEVLQLANAIRTAEAPTQEMANSLQRAEANLERAGRAFQTESGKLAVLDAALKQAGVDTQHLATEMDRVTAAAGRLGAAQTAVAGKLGGKGNFLGLNSFELQNLGFQINDIFVSLASGQAPLRVLIQQGAQIGQLPGVLSRVIAFLPQIATLGTAFVIVGSAIKHTADEAERLATGESIVQGMGAGTEVTAQQFATLGKALDDLGVKSDDARKALVEMAADGLNADQMQQYIDTAKAASEVTGVDFKDALENIRETFQGGFDDILKLQEATGTYTDQELDLIQTLFEHGQADEARAKALGIYQAKAQEIADAQKGPWRIAVDQLKQGWDNFIAGISNTSIFQNTYRELNTLARYAATVGALLNQISQGKFDLAAAQKTAAGVPAPKPAGGGKPAQSAPSRRLNAQADHELKVAQATTREKKKQLVYDDAIVEANNAGVRGAEAVLYANKKVAAFNAAEDVRQGKRDAAASKRAGAAQRRQEAAARAAANRAKAEANRIDNAQEAIQRQIEQMDGAVAKATGADDLQLKLDAITEHYAKLFRDIEDFSKKTGGKGLINGKSIQSVKDQAIANEKVLKDYATLEDFEKKIGALEKDRKARLDEIADAVERGTIKPEDGLAQSKAVIDQFAGRIAEVSQSAITFAAAMKAAAGTKPTPELDAFLSKMQTLGQQNSGGTNAGLVNKVTDTSVEEAQAALNKMVQDRNALVEHENNLVTAGIHTYSEAQKRIQDFYNNTNDAIKKQIALVLQLASSWATGTPEQQRAFAALQANLANVSLEAQGTDVSFQNLKSHVTDILATNIVGFIDSVAQSFANLVSGNDDVLGFLASVGKAFLQMIANILQTVATLIIEAFVLDAVDKATGGILKPLLKIASQAVSIRHEGGVIGDVGGRKRSVSPAAFIGAPKYHTGGIAGLAPDEHAAILRKGEEVLTEADPRHRNNGGLTPGSGPTMGGIRQVLAVGDDEIAGAMQGAAGEKVVLTHIRRNRASIKQALDAGA